jgi:signal transduction histidine kinase
MRATGLAVDIRRTGEPGQPMPPDVDAAAYMIVQEALTNVLRHASARLVVVGISVEVGLTLTVTDDGRGGPMNDEGMGLRGMRERAEALGGTLSAGPRPGGGFEVIVELPL